MLKATLCDSCTAVCNCAHLWLFGPFEKVGHTPGTAATFRKKFGKFSGKTPETLSERFLAFPSRVRLGDPKRYNSRHLRLPEHFPNSLPLRRAGDASVFRSGSGKGLSELVMEFPAVLRVFLKREFSSPNDTVAGNCGQLRTGTLSPRLFSDILAESSTK